MNVLVINSGSSSVKFQVIDVVSEDVLLKGLVDGIGLDHCSLKFNGVVRDLFVKDHVDALKLVIDSVKEFDIKGVGHRFVHGGSVYTKPVLITDVVLNDLNKLNDLAPLHNPHNLAGILACNALLAVPQVVVFDTSFHSSISAELSSYALPSALVSELGLKKFGFHGVSHHFLSLEASKLLKLDECNVITCHLGNGASVACVKRGVCVDTSMGFSPLDGLVMGSRCGSLDPGVMLFLQEKLGLGVDELRNLLNKDSGLKGLCGDQDMRLVLKRFHEGDERAILAVNVFVKRVVHFIGAYLALMGETTHCLVFSGGVGEGSDVIRSLICEDLNHLGVVLDVSKNEFNNGSFSDSVFINSDYSKVKVLVIPTNEELMIAREIKELLF